MQASTDLPPSALRHIAGHILTSRRITRADQRTFMSAALSSSLLSGEDQELVDRVFDALRRGMVRVVE